MYFHLYTKVISGMTWSMGPFINDVSSEVEGAPQKPMKGDENRYLVLGKADVVY